MEAESRQLQLRPCDEQRCLLSEQRCPAKRIRGHGHQHGTRMGSLSGKNKKKKEEEEDKEKEEEATCKSNTMAPQKAGAQDRRRCRRRGDETGCQGRKVAID